MGRRNVHSREEQREMAIAAAELILMREGIAGLSMRKVAVAIGYTVGNLYLLFKNQDDLLAAVNERTTDDIHARLVDAAGAHTSATEKIRAMGHAYIDYATQNPSRWRLMFEHQLPLDMLPRPSSDLRIARMFEQVESAVALLLPGVRKERLRRTATALWSGVHGVCTLAVTGKLKWSGISDYAPICDELIDSVLAGLTAASARKSGATRS